PMRYWCRSNQPCPPMRSRISTSRSRLSLSPLSAASVGKPASACRPRASRAPANPSMASSRHVIGRTALWGVMLSSFEIGVLERGHSKGPLSTKRKAYSASASLARQSVNATNDKGPGNAGAFKTPTLTLRLLERGRNLVEVGRQLAADAVDGGDDRDRDASGNQTVFDGGGAGLI